MNSFIRIITALLIVFCFASCTSTALTSPDDPVAATVQAAQTQTQIAHSVQQTLNPPTATPAFNVGGVTSLTLEFDGILSSNYPLNNAGETSVSFIGGEARFVLLGENQGPNFYIQYRLPTFDEDDGILAIDGNYYTRNSRYQTNWIRTSTPLQDVGALKAVFDIDLSPAVVAQQFLGFALPQDLSGWTLVGEEMRNGTSQTHYRRDAVINASAFTHLFRGGFVFSTTQLDMWIAQDGRPHYVTLIFNFTDSSSYQYSLTLNVNLLSFNEPISLPTP